MVSQQQECEEKWLMHYSSLHQILVVGDGDFSFSLCLANSFGSAFNILASSLDSYDMVTKKYKNAKSNLEKLRHLGATILHGVDAIKMKLHTDLRMRKFDRIIFNFPHAGFHGKEDNVRLIQMHRTLIHGFFRNASGMLRAYGEIHVSHKTTAPFCHWNLAELASKSSLVLIDCIDFNSADYPGYNQKRGDSARCDEPFPLGKCSTFKFIFSPSAKKIPNSLHHNGLAQRHPRVSVTMPQLPTTLPRVLEAPCPIPQLSTPFDAPIAPYSFSAHTVSNGSSHCAGLAQSHPRVSVTMPQLSTTLPRVLEAPCPIPQFSTTFDAPYSFNAHTVMNGSSHWAGFPQTSEKENLQIFGGYFNHARETFGKVEYNIESSVCKQYIMHA
ncbi:heavy metal-associated isoprenylated plant protein 41-like [Ipomoea triloba]|uniref:heavy metal-associated isoprenylated plant protein 41-like n=1 Tax=Ipomoea triloba TaxID=35885 RepID=UPI00125E96E4|nr:heavy metal-associated isoprenylated plant protein 41-like [Ipomoea triloba]